MGVPTLEDGASPTTPPGDTLQRRFTLALAARIEAEATAMADDVVRTDELVFGHRGYPNPILNQCVLLRPPTAIAADRLAELLDRCLAYGSPVSLWSLWPVPDLSPQGWVLAGHPPFMVRPVGPPPPGAAPPAGLEITEIDRDEDYATFVRVAVESFGMDNMRDVTDRIWDARIREHGWRLWLGRLDGEPVATAAAFTSHGVNLVEIIATATAARGRGIGAAVTWAATLADPDVPAVLFASDLGRPVYERMGYLPISRATLSLGGLSR
jgi:hypothetical protein